MEQKETMRFYVIEKLTFLYMLLTSFIIIFHNFGAYSTYHMLLRRLVITGVIMSMAYLSTLKEWKTIRFVRCIFVGILLVYWYPETFDINRNFQNYDFLLAGIEQNIFGFQPALLFSQMYPQHWLNELMNMGYFAYYPLIICTGLYFWFKNPTYFEYFFFSVIFSFFVYYLIFDLFAVAGPQFYFSAIGVENVKAGIFPQIGHYFSVNPELTVKPGNTGFFLRLVETTQHVGERPTAAFPSSHVGISTLILLLILRNKRYRIFGIIFPFYILLVASTVYIQAHYVIDVIAGWISAVGLFYLSRTAYKVFTPLSVEYPAGIELQPVQVHSKEERDE